MTQNPYLSPQFGNDAGSHSPVNGHIDPKQLQRIETIIKDANQFWLAILMCFFCSGLGMLIIAPWYGVRLMQWSRLRFEDPRLVSPDVPPGSIAARFQAAKPKLIAGIVFGVVMAAIATLGILAYFALSRVQ